MKLAIMQPYLFPYLGYFQLMHAVDRFVVDDDVTFIKQGWINRNRILINGAAVYFTVPLRHASSFALITTRSVDDAGSTRGGARSCSRRSTTSTGGRRSSRRVFPLVEARDRRRPRTSPTWPWRASGRSPSSSSMPDRSSRARRGYGNAHLKGEDRVIDDLPRRGRQPTTSTRPADGALLARAISSAQGIRLHFIQPRPIEYRQFDAPFVPSLSIVDVLMFNPRRDGRATFLDAVRARMTRRSAASSSSRSPAAAEPYHADAAALRERPRLLSRVHPRSRAVPRACWCRSTSATRCLQPLRGDGRRRRVLRDRRGVRSGPAGGQRPRPGECLRRTSTTSA